MNTSIEKKHWTRFLPVAARVLMGLLFVVTGLNLLAPFLPQPEQAMSPGATAMMTGFMQSGYMMKLIGATQLIAGLLLLSGFFVPLALVLIAPVIVNIFAFHFFLAPDGNGMAISLAFIEIYLAWSYRKTFAPLFVPRMKNPG